jgi:hypothetical protein
MMQQQPKTRAGLQYDKLIISRFKVSDGCCLVQCRAPGRHFSRQLPNYIFSFEGSRFIHCQRSSSTARHTMTFVSNWDQNCDMQAE